MDIVEALEERDADRAVELVRAYHERTLDLLGFGSRTRFA
jgi:DNA-binding GntR family transcriptional regulator